jgi:hypothetical protein
MGEIKTQKEMERRRKILKEQGSGKKKTFM